MNTIPIRFKKGISGNQNLKSVDNGMVSRAVINAALAVALFPEHSEKEYCKNTGRYKTRIFLDKLVGLFEYA